MAQRNLRAICTRYILGHFVPKQFFLSDRLQEGPVVYVEGLCTPLSVHFPSTFFPLAALAVALAAERDALNKTAEEEGHRKLRRDVDLMETLPLNRSQDIFPIPISGALRRATPGSSR